MGLILKKIKEKDVIVKVDIKSGKVIIDNLEEIWEKMGVASLSSNIVCFPEKNNNPEAFARLTVGRSRVNA